jgi:hypothetical protein
MDRRQFCLSSAVLATGFAAGRVFPSPQAPSLVLHEVLFDARFSAARDFGAAAARLGQKTAAIQGDVTALWLHDLWPRWSAGGGTIAGMTSARSLLCLEQLAQNHWMPVIVRAEHRPLAAGATAHRVSAMEPALARICCALAGGLNWPGHLADVLTSLPRFRGAPRASREVRSEWSGQAEPLDEQLVSWVIAGEDA